MIYALTFSQTLQFFQAQLFLTYIFIHSLSFTKYVTLHTRFQPHHK